MSRLVPRLALLGAALVLAVTMGSLFHDFVVGVAIVGLPAACFAAVVRVQRRAARRAVVQRRNQEYDTTRRWGAR